MPDTQARGALGLTPSGEGGGHAQKTCQVGKGAGGSTLNGPSSTHAYLRGPGAPSREHRRLRVGAGCYPGFPPGVCSAGDRVQALSGVGGLAGVAPSLAQMVLQLGGGMHLGGGCCGPGSPRRGNAGWPLHAAEGRGRRSPLSLCGSLSGPNAPPQSPPPPTRRLCKGAPCGPSWPPPLPPSPPTCRSGSLTDLTPARGPVTPTDHGDR